MTIGRKVTAYTSDKNGHMTIDMKCYQVGTLIVAYIYGVW